MTELALTRIFSVTMYYHFAFLAISIALFGLSASGVYVYLSRHRMEKQPARALLSFHALGYAVVTTVALALLVRIRVGLNYSPENMLLMLAIYGLAALPFFAGGSVISLAVARLSGRINLVYAADLVGAAAGCLILIPLLDRLGAPGVIVASAILGSIAAVLFAPRASLWRTAPLALGAVALALTAVGTGLISFDVVDTKGHVGDRVLFSRWNSFSRVAVYERSHGDWSLSPRYTGPRPETRFMDIDSAASTPILRLTGDVGQADYLKYELTALAYHLKDGASDPFTALVIGPGGGRDLLSALVFGASRVDGVEINPIIARDVMLDRFKAFSGGIYANPRVRIYVEDGRSFVRRSPERYDVIQASLVDTWAATAAGAYTLTENTLYTVEAFDDYLDHLSDGGVLTITRWVFDGVRLVSLAQQACAARGVGVADRVAVVQQDRVATFILKKTPFTGAEVQRLREVSDRLGFTPLYLPGDTAGNNDYAKLILATDRQRFYDNYPQDVTPTTDDRPFFFHTTKLRDQTQVAFGRTMLFGNGLSALMSLMAISAALVVAFIVGPLALSGRELLGSRWAGWLTYFGLLGAGFMLIEVALLQRFVLLLGHPVYSLTVTLFSLLLGGGVGSFVSRHIGAERLRGWLATALLGVVALVALAAVALPWLVASAISATLATRIALAAGVLVPAGVVMGVPLPAGMRLLSAARPQLIPWAWAMNGALSVLGATVAVFIAMNWGFSMTLASGAAAYLLAASVVLVGRR
jgi:predicted membrane-bound spermidine synthase